MGIPYAFQYYYNKYNNNIKHKIQKITANHIVGPIKRKQFSDYFLADIKVNAYINDILI